MLSTRYIIDANVKVSTTSGSIIKETIKELRQIAKDEGLTGFSYMNKEKLLSFIENRTNMKTGW